MKKISLPEAVDIAAEALAELGGKVAVVGSLNADVTIETEVHPKPGETVVGGPLRVLPGGKSANQAVASGKLGMDVSMIGCLGDDSNAQVLRESLAGAGVDTTNVRVAEGMPTGAAVIIVDAKGENSIVISAGSNGLVDAKFVEAAADAITGASVLGLCFEVPMDAVLTAAKTANKAGVTVVLNYSPIVTAPAELLQLVDVLIVNEHELSAVAGRAVDTSSIDDVKAALAELNMDRAVVTLGGEGSVAFDCGEVTQVPPFPITPVDTTGAGDCFMAALLSALASGMPLARGAVLASAVSALSATAVGAQSSYRGVAEVQGFLNSYR